MQNAITANIYLFFSTGLRMCMSITHHSVTVYTFFNFMKSAVPHFDTHQPRTSRGIYPLALPSFIIPDVNYIFLSASLNFNFLLQNTFLQTLHHEIIPLLHFLFSPALSPNLRPLNAQHLELWFPSVLYLNFITNSSVKLVFALSILADIFKYF